MAMVLALLALVFLSFSHAVTAFTGPRSGARPGVGRISRVGVRELHRSSPTRLLSSAGDDSNWGLDDVPEEDPRMDAMRSLLESSWDDVSMGIVPSSPEKAADAAAESVADAMAQNRNVLMIDLRLPSYDITEGSNLYDIMAAYDFCSFLSDNLRERNLIRKSLVLVRNEKERAEIDRVDSRRGGPKTTMSNTAKDDDIGGDEAREASGGGTEVDDFRKQLMSSWDSPSDDVGTGESTQAAPQPASDEKVARNTDNSSHRLWSVIGKEEITAGGPDMFDQVIAAVDDNARLSADEDALIILSPYDTIDVIGMRRIMARYGQTRTIVIVNSRMEMLPRELDPAVLVYGVMPLIAVARGNNVGNEEAGLKAVVMKRFPADWSVYVDVYGDGFVEARAGTQSGGGSDKEFPSPEWIASRVSAHVEGLPKQ